MNLNEFLMTVAAGVAVYLIIGKLSIAKGAQGANAAFPGRGTPSVYTDAYGSSYVVSTEQAAMLAEQDRAFADWSQPNLNPNTKWM